MIPFVRDLDFAYGRCDQVSPLIRRVVANNPGPFTYLGTGTYIVGAGEVAVIDPGPDLPEHLDALMAALEGEKVSHILVTHHHLDHSPLARQLSALTGAPVYGCAAALAAAPVDHGVELEAGHDAFTPDISICGGALIKGAGWTIEAIPTPGHTANHLCYALTEENALFTGDHIMGWSTTVVAPPDGDMGAYLASLARVQARNFATLWPTHGPPIREVSAFIAAYIAHREMREGEILREVRLGSSRISDIVPKLYAAVDPRLHPAAARSVHAHLIELVRTGQVACDGEPSLGARYTPGKA